MSDQKFHSLMSSLESMPPMEQSRTCQYKDLPSSGGNIIAMESHKELDNIGAMKEMMYKIAVMQPVDIDLAAILKPRRRNVRISNDPQSVSARLRRERISERIRILGRLVPGGSKMDTASMLDEAILYVKFLKRLVEELQSDQPPPPLLHVKGASLGCHDLSSVGHMTNLSPSNPSSSSSLAPLASASLLHHWYNRSF